MNNRSGFACRERKPPWKSGGRVALQSWKRSRGLGEIDLTTETSKGGERNCSSCDGLSREFMKMRMEDNWRLAWKKHLDLGLWFLALFHLGTYCLWKRVLFKNNFIMIFFSYISIPVSPPSSCFPSLPPTSTPFGSSERKGLCWKSTKSVPLLHWGRTTALPPCLS